MRRIETESRRWFLQCPDCGFEISVWDSGGMRFRARGKAYRRGRCRGCNRVGMLRLYQRDENDDMPMGQR